MSLLNKLSDRIKECRTKLYLSQEYVANFMTLNRTIITQIENGHRMVSAEELAKFSSLFGMSADTLLNGQKTEMPTTMFARNFDELNERDKDEILNLIQFKKLMQQQQKQMIDFQNTASKINNPEQFAGIIFSLLNFGKLEGVCIQISISSE